MSQKNTKQDVYAANLRQNLGYPLRSPNPTEDDQLGLWIGDVGHVNELGQFVVLWNVCHGDSPSGVPPFQRIPPVEELIRTSPIPENVLMTGVEQDTSQSSDDYKFTATSNAGAVLIIPSGATLYELRDQQKLNEFRDLITKHALDWCRCANQDSLSLITGVCKTSSWTLGAFEGRSRGKDITIKKSDDRDPSTTAYKWSTTFDLDYQSCLKDDALENQTVFVRGFRVKTGQANDAVVVDRMEGVQLVGSVERGGGRQGILASWLARHLPRRSFRPSRK